MDHAVPQALVDSAAATRGRDLGGRTKGTPQGGVFSPVLVNLFLHYTFDVWMTKHYPDNPWSRYADDGLVHCRTVKCVSLPRVLRVFVSMVGASIPYKSGGVGIPFYRL